MAESSSHGPPFCGVTVFAAVLTLLDDRRRRHVWRANGRAERPRRPPAGASRQRRDLRRAGRAAAPRRRSGRTRTGNADGSGSRSADWPGPAPRRAAPRAGSRSRPGAAPRRSAPRCTDAAAAPRAGASAPVSTIRPRYITETASATWRTIARSCEISSRPSPRSRERSTSRFASCACAEASSDASGSSSTITDGSAASARAIAIRWRCPPENSCGNRRPRPPGDRRARSARGRGQRVRRRGTMLERVERVSELRADLAARVERRVRVLEDELQPRELARRGRAGRAGSPAPLEEHRARRRRTSPTAARARRRLAAPGLADQARRSGPARPSGSRPRPRAPGRRRALVVDDDVANLEHAHRSANGSTGQASSRPLDADERRHVACGSPPGHKRSVGGTRIRRESRPGWAARRRSRRAACRCAASGCGSASSSARVYGWRGRRRTASREPDSTTRPA